jgi:hypothetical protein
MKYYEKEEDYGYIFKIEHDFFPDAVDRQSKEWAMKLLHQELSVLIDKNIITIHVPHMQTRDVTVYLSEGNPEKIQEVKDFLHYLMDDDNLFKIVMANLIRNNKYNTSENYNITQFKEELNHQYLFFKRMKETNYHEIVKELYSDEKVERSKKPKI